MNPSASEALRVRIENFQRTNQLGVATLFFSDLVGSTQLKQNLGDREAIQLIQAHHAAYRKLLAQFPNAEEIGNAGDSFFLIFAAPSDAVRFALLAQARTHALATESGCPLLDRIGIHIGEVFIKAPEQAGQVKDLFGIQVDTCARIMSLGDGDQILLSRFAFDNARQALRGDSLDGLGEIAWLNHGFYEMKGVEEPVEICEVGEVGRARLAAPETGEKGHRIVTGDEHVLGWRPAAGQFVPDTQWLLDRLLGEGGFGEVWLAHHQTLKDRRVLKFCFNAEKARSLKREVTLFRVLREHVGARPGIVTVHDVYFDQPPLYIVMDHIDGPTLTGWAESHLPLDAVPLETRLEIVAQIADALQTAHDAGVIHRDVKPSNILITEEAGAPRALLTDFGIGQLVSGATPAGITQLGFTDTMMAADSLTGTQLYLAPELLARQPATIRSDIYALGVVLYQLTVGALNRPLTSDWADDIDDPLLRADIRDCVAGDPAKRFAGGAQLSSHLRALPQRHADHENTQQLQARAERRRQQMRLATLLAAAIAITAAAFAFAFLRERDLKSKVTDEGARAEREALRAKGEAQRAENALSNLKGTAPDLLALAASEAGLQRYESALKKTEAALALDPNLAAAYWSRGWALFAQEKLPEAVAALRLAAENDPSNRRNAALLPLVEKMAAAPVEKRHDFEIVKPLYDHLTAVGAVGEATPLLPHLKLGNDARRALVRERVESWLGKLGAGAPRFVGLDKGQLMVRLSGLNLGNLDSLRGLPIEALQVDGCGITSLEPLRGMSLLRLFAARNAIDDLEPLKGMPLEYLNLDGCPLRNLSPLRGMPLKTFICKGARDLTDLGPLKGTQLEELHVNTCPVSDFSPIYGMPLKKFIAVSIRFVDARLLTGMPLVDLDLTNATSFFNITAFADLPLHVARLRGCPITDFSPLLRVRTLEALETSAAIEKILPLRAHPGLKQIKLSDAPYRPVAEFWAEYDAQQAAGKK